MRAYERSASLPNRGRKIWARWRTPKLWVVAGSRLVGISPAYDRGVRTFRELPGPARVIAETTTDAVTAAWKRDLPAFEESADRLSLLDPEQVGIVLGAVVRSLLEDRHQDGLTGDDVQAVLERCARSALEWCPRVDPAVLLVLLAGALGVHPDQDESPPPDGAAVTWHAPLLVADLAGTDRDLAGHLRAAFAEIARAETLEAP